MGIGPTPITSCNLIISIKTLSPNQSHSEVPVFRISTYEFGGRSTIQPITPPKASVASCLGAGGAGSVERPLLSVTCYFVCLHSSSVSRCRLGSGRLRTFR